MNQLSASAGYQKSFHHSHSDRDLIVTRVDWLPPKGWNFLGTAWIDLYNGGDTQKDSSAEVTLAEEPSAAQLKDITAALKEVAGKDVDVSLKVDPAIIGGLVVKMGSRMVDASLKTKLNSIRLAMKEVG